MNKPFVLLIITFASFLLCSVSIAGDFFSTHVERFLGPNGQVVEVVFWDAPIRVSNPAPASMPTDLPITFPDIQFLDASPSTPSLFSSAVGAFSEPIRLTIDNSQPNLNSVPPKKP